MTKFPLVNCCQTLDGPIDATDATEVAEVLKALADPVRLQLVSLIAGAEGGEACACDLPEAVGRSQPTVSHHLGVLVEAGLVEREQRGRWAWFRLVPDRFEAICRAISPT